MVSSDSGCSCVGICLALQVLSARKISVTNSYCDAFYFVLFFLRSVVRTFVGSRVVSFVSLVSSFVCFVIISVVLALV